MSATLRSGQTRFQRQLLSHAPGSCPSALPPAADRLGAGLRHRPDPLPVRHLLPDGHHMRARRILRALRRDLLRRWALLFDGRDLPARRPLRAARFATLRRWTDLPARNLLRHGRGVRADRLQRLRLRPVLPAGQPVPAARRLRASGNTDVRRRIDLRTGAEMLARRRLHALDLGGLRQWPLVPGADTLPRRRPLLGPRCNPVRARHDLPSGKSLHT